jgi:hypothetical protein
VEAVPLQVSLTVTPERVTEDELGGLTVRVSVANEGAEPVDLQLPASRLTVDGRPLQAWNLAIGNGARDARESALPPGDSVEAARVLGASLVREPGDHEVAIEVLGVRSAPVRLRVEPAGR